MNFALVLRSAMFFLENDWASDPRRKKPEVKTGCPTSHYYALLFYRDDREPTERKRQDMKHLSDLKGEFLSNLALFYPKYFIGQNVGRSGIFLRQLTFFYRLVGLSDVSFIGCYGHLVQMNQ